VGNNARLGHVRSQQDALWVSYAAGADAGTWSIPGAEPSPVPVCPPRALWVLFVSVHTEKKSERWGFMRFPQSFANVRVHPRAAIVFPGDLPTRSVESRKWC